MIATGVNVGLAEWIIDGTRVLFIISPQYGVKECLFIMEFCIPTRSKREIYKSTFQRDRTGLDSTSCDPPGSTIAL